jgi:protocatechuate 3,4-dioxygenase beta subunit
MKTAGTHLESHHHGHSLAEDLPRMEAQRLERRRALLWLSSSALLAGCGGGGGSDSSGTSALLAATAAASTTTAASTSSTAVTTATTTTTTSTTSDSACPALPAETAGPYPADGTNTSSGSTSDVLTASGIVRSDIRSSFISSSTVAQGVALTITLTLENTNASCTALAGYAIYLWHCDRSGNYSLYTASTESYLRGVQVTDSAGQVSFMTIFPACYAGRWPHMHFEVFSSLSSATTGRNAVLTSQLAMPSDVCNAIYPNVTGYSASVTNLAAVSLAADNVFGDNTAVQLAAMTPSMSGSVNAGYTARAVIGLAV